MDIAARLTSKGQITVPKPVRDALALRPGDEVVFRLHGDRAVVAKTPDFLDLAGAIPVPAGKRGTSWDRVLAETRRAQAESRR
ncbi:MAG TPA: AbrB/MazE/SpoVT family DNA-binding domain-containing protein [Solirubrobacteraceae bacterium]|nr:AbrB/MazE/SpoVT family DNA-binding domain-containing protein [Solirubrobacteraceae bacterium]